MKRKRRLKLLITLFLLLVLGGLYGGLLLVVSPARMGEQVKTFLERSLSVQASVAKVSLNPLRGVVVRGLEVKDTSGKNFLSIPKLALRHELRSLIAGDFRVRKLKVYDPKIWLRRDRYGRWNIPKVTLDHLEGEEPIKFQVRDVSLRGGQITVEDEFGERHLPELKITNIIFETHSPEKAGGPMTIYGGFKDELFGSWNITGAYDPESVYLDIRISKKDLKIDDSLRNFLGAIQTESGRELESVNGMLDVDFQLTHTSADRPKLEYSLIGLLRDFNLRFKNVPYGLEELSGEIKLSNGKLFLRDVSAHVGDARVRADGVLGKAQGAISIEVADLALDDEMKSMLDDQRKAVWDQLRPSGSIDISCQLVKKEAGPAGFDPTAVITLKDCAAQGAALPFPVENISGQLTLRKGEASLKAIRGMSPVGPLSVRDATLSTTSPGEKKVEVELQDVDLRQLVDVMASRNEEVGRKLGRYELEGVADIVCTLSQEAEGKEKGFTVVADFRDMKMKHPAFKQRLTAMNGSMVIDGQRLAIRSASGKSGDNPITVKDLEYDLAGGALTQGTITIQNYSLDAELKALLPESTRKLLDDLQLKGKVDIVSHISPEPEKSLITVTLRNCNASYVRFPFPIYSICGELILQGDTLAFKGVHGQNRDAAITLEDATVSTSGEEPMRLVFHARDLPLSDELREALPESMKAQWGRFNPTGSVNTDCTVTFKQGMKGPPEVVASVEWNDSGITYADFPYPVSHVTGRTEFHRDKVMLIGVQGKAGAGFIRFRDTTIFLDEEQEKNLTIEGTGMLLDSKLRECLRKDIQTAWDIVNPSGRFNFVWSQEREKGKGKQTSYLIELTLDNATMECSYFRYPLREMTGKILFTGGTARLEKVVGKNGPAVIEISGMARGAAGPDEDKIHLNIKGRNVPLDEDVGNALPTAEYRKRVWPELEPKGLIDFEGSLRFRAEEPEGVVICYNVDRVLFKDCSLKLGGIDLQHIKGEMILEGESLVHTAETPYREKRELGKADNWLNGDLQLEQVIIEGKKYTDLTTKFFALFYGEDFEFHAHRIEAFLYEGRFLGSITIERNPKRWETDEVIYSGEFWAKDVNVKDLVEMSGIRVSGMAGVLEAKSWTQGAGANLNELESRGWMRIKEGALGDLPKTLGIPLFAKAKKPRHFSEAYLEYRLKEGNAIVDKLDLLGDTLCLRGEGTVGLDKSLKLIFRTEAGTKDNQLWKLFRKFVGPIVPVRLTGTLNEPIWKVDPLIPFSKLLHGLAGVFRTEKEQTE